MKTAFLSVLLSVAALTAQAQTALDASASPGPLAPGSKPRDVRVVVHTDKGDVNLTIFASTAPIAAASFLNLAQKKFYDGLAFHRVEPGFVIQGGDPLGNGRGGPGYTFEDEPNGERRFDKAGVLSMANRGPSTNGSQFFITLGAAAGLNDGAGNGHYTIFGEVTKGQNVVDQIRVGDKIKGIDILDSTQPLFAAQAGNLARWNASVKSKD